MKNIVLVSVCSFLCVSCFSGKSSAESTKQHMSSSSQKPVEPINIVFSAPSSIPVNLIERMNAQSSEFLLDLQSVLKKDTENLLLLVDKKNHLSPSFIPEDILPLSKNKSYNINREGLSLRRCAEEALEKMAAAARADGVTLLVSSSYRSYEYQEKVYERNVRELGKEAADRESAMPGASQHQLGTAVDFGSITDAFADTAAGKWLSVHAEEYGWSLSFPQGYEDITGYRWESWHYLYIGKEAAAFQAKWFGGIQHYMIEFIDAWKKQASSQKTFS
ncbi:MAG TPA: M15 family metallopeptidase [Treponemataceae bacterium]|nr:M15 family metallopeptidase [Treponemataceae bacterium]